MFHVIFCILKNHISKCCFIYVGLKSSSQSNVIVAMDTSVDVSMQTLQNMRKFAKNLIKMFTVSSRNTKLSLLTYGDSAKEIVDNVENEESFLQGLANAVTIGGQRKLKSVLDLIQKKNLQNAKDTLLILLVAGPGSLTERPLLTTSGYELRSKGITVKVYGIGNTYIPDELLQITGGDPIKDADDLPSVVDDVDSDIGGVFGKLS